MIKRIVLIVFVFAVIGIVNSWVPIDIRTVPRANDKDTIDVVYLQAPLLKWKFGDILADFHLFHTAVGFKHREKNFDWTVEYDAVPDLFGAVLPIIVNETLIWKNDGAAIVYGSINSTYWSSSNKVLTQINGTIYNSMLEWMLTVNSTLPYYNLFNVMHKWTIDKNSYYLQSNTCADFQLLVFDFLATLGADFKGPVMKDDVNLYTTDRPRLVSFEENKGEILAFYELLTAKFSKMEHLHIAEIIEEIYQLVRGEVYLYYNQSYYLCKLHWPNIDWKYYARPIRPLTMV